MDENNKNPNPQTKKSLGMLIMILALVLVVVVLVIVIVASSGKDDTTTPTSSTPSDPTVTTDPTGTTGPDTTTPPETTTSATPKPPVNPVNPTLTEKPQTAGDDGKVNIAKDLTNSGLLTLVDNNHPYKYLLDSLFKGTHETKYDDVKKAGYDRISSKFPAPTAGHFLRQEAFDALVALITTFESVSGTDKTFIVNGYTAANASTTTDDMITGTVVRLYIKGDTGNYGFNYGSKKVTVNGTSMTYEAWFKENCAKYGFVYEGLVGSNENYQAGQFRYVGSIHAAGIKAAGSLEKYIAAVKAGTVTTATAADGSTWKVSYAAAADAATTEIEVGAKASYVISGDNMGGFIVAVKTPAA